MRKWLYISLLCFSFWGKSQNYFIAFKDKLPFDTEIASKQVSILSKIRRQNQNIAFDESDSPINPTYIQNIKALGLHVIFQSKWLNGVLVDTTNSSLISQIQQMAFVQYVHDLQQTSVGGIMELETYAYGSNQKTIDFFNIKSFHELNILGEGKLIAVFDGGFTGVNNLIAFQNTSFVDTYNFVSPKNSVFETSSHGTHVLSIISANETGKYVGIAPAASIALYKTENTVSESILEEYNWLFAAERADSLGVDIINSSVGYYNFDYPSTNHTFGQLDGATSTISKAANLASQKGILVVISTGNSNASSVWPYINFPADAPLALSVGSIDDNGVLSSFSSHGPINGLWYKPELVAPGKSVAVLNASGEAATSTGTSMSAPTITGLAALVWCKNPSFTAQELKQFLIQNASQTNNPDQEKGYGYPITSKILSIDIKVELANIPIEKIEYFDLLGHRFGQKPWASGAFIQLIWYKNGTFAKELIYID